MWEESEDTREGETLVVWVDFIRRFAPIGEGKTSLVWVGLVRSFVLIGSYYLRLDFQNMHVSPVSRSLLSTSSLLPSSFPLLSPCVLPSFLCQPLSSIYLSSFSLSSTTSFFSLPFFYFPHFTPCFFFSISFCLFISLLFLPLFYLLFASFSFYLPHPCTRSLFYYY